MIARCRHKGLGQSLLGAVELNNGGTSMALNNEAFNKWGMA